MIDILWESFVAWLIRVDKSTTRKFTDTYYLILTTKDGYECGRTNNKEMLDNLHILAKKDKKNLVEVGLVYYIIFGYFHGLGYV